MQLKLTSNPAVEKKINTYPANIQEKLYHLRQLILDTATEIEDLTALEETLKWREPSYLAKKGSTIRIDWKPAKPAQYAIYFKCTSKLVSTFKVHFKLAKPPTKVNASPDDSVKPNQYNASTLSQEPLLPY